MAASDSYRPARTSPLITSADGGHALVQQFELRVLEGPDEGVVFASDGERVALGTHNANQLMLHDDAVSRFHCEISIPNGRAVLRDLQSTNGTFVGSTSVVEAHLRDGSTIGLGRTKIKFALSKKQVKVALSPRREYGLLVGGSPAMRAVFAVFEQAALSDCNILLSGETGTGKEAAAESIHQHSARKDGPLVVVDCGGIASTLLESELFGHEKGAFTDALETRKGAFEQAQHGTLFLDEIGELSLDLQPKLLRALESREVKRVGGSRYIPVDVRIIAATHRNLRADLNDKRFRPDLYYRLAVVEVRLPALRDRTEDLPLLVEKLLKTMTVENPAQYDLVRSDAFLSDLENHNWPGNIRELRNYLESCLVLNKLAPLGDDAASKAREPQSLNTALAERERDYMADLIRRHQGGVAAILREAKVSRAQYYRLLARHKLRE